MFVAAREELRSTFVAPALARDDHVISDRAASSTLAYQIFGRQRHDQLPLFKYLNGLHTCNPTLYIFLDLDPEEAAKRIGRRSTDQDRFDKEGVAFQIRVREGFRAFPEFVPGVSCHFVDASQSPEKVLVDVLAIIVEHLATFT